MGSARGKKPLVVDTMKAGSVLSSGLVSRRTSKGGSEPREPMMKLQSETNVRRKVVGVVEKYV
jgi:hypothetical protein